jgi:hypothetical protein
MMTRSLLGVRRLTLRAVRILPGLRAAQRSATPDSTKGPSAKKDLPIVAMRSATFTGTKGTCVSLDVSPDGQSIVFEFPGDVYTLPIAGGAATRMTSGIALDAQLQACCGDK